MSLVISVLMPRGSLQFEQAKIHFNFSIVWSNSHRCATIESIEQEQKVDIQELARLQQQSTSDHLMVEVEDTVKAGRPRCFLSADRNAPDTVTLHRYRDGGTLLRILDLNTERGLKRLTELNVVGHTDRNI